MKGMIKMRLPDVKKDYSFRLPVELYNEIFTGNKKSKLLEDILDNYVRSGNNDKVSKV